MACAMMTAMTYRGIGRIPLVLSVVFGLLGLAISGVTPPGKFPDELSHLNYIRFVRTHHQLPPVGLSASEMLIGQGFQPPLYYGVAALLVPASGQDNIFLTRCFSLLLGVLTIVLVLQTARVIFPDSLQVVLLSGAFVAFTPRFLYTCSGIGNLPMTAMTCALTLYLFARMLRSQGSLWRLSLAMGLAFGLALLSRTTAIYLLPVCFGGILYRHRSEKKLAWAPAIRQILIFSAAAFLISGWWYVRNWMLYGDPVLWNVVRETSGSPWMRSESPSLFYFMKQIAFLHASYWAYFGEAEFHAGIWEYAVYLFLMCVAFVGLFEIGTGRTQFKKAFAVSVLWLFVIASILAVLEILLVQVRMDAPEGRYLYMAVSPISISLSAGLIGTIPSRFQMRAAVAMSLFLFAFCLYLLLFYWLPHFI